MRILQTSNRRAVDQIVARDFSRDPRVERTAARIVADVRRRGDRALRDWMRRLDGIEPPFPISRAELRRACAATPPDVRRAIRRAAANIRRVAEQQLPRPFAIDVQPGVRIEQRVEPLRRAGCYVPGGRYPLPSTVLMTVIPAVVAGVGEIVVVCPQPGPAVLCAAVEAGATQVLRLGGAQAIAALAYGAGTVLRVDKIVGPGNAWVAAAKALVSRDCAIDFQAGPSEIVIWSDRGRPDWIAADLIAQAEHDPAARAILVTTKRPLAAAVAASLKRQAPAAGPAAVALEQNGAVIVARNRQEAVDLIRRIAPEHLVCDRNEDASAVGAAGTVFVGDWSAQALGDYCTGSNHVLPTGGAARFRGGLSAADFVRVFTVQTVTRQGIGAIGPAAVTLARAEGLEAHAKSVAMRLSRSAV